jgi:hypothetical protein
MPKKFNKINEKRMMNIFESIDDAKSALKVYLIYATNAQDLNKYKMEILTTNEVNETLEYLQYVLASNSKFSKRVASLSSSIINHNIDILKKGEQSEISKTAIKTNEELVKHLEKLKEM